LIKSVPHIPDQDQAEGAALMAIEMSDDELVLLWLVYSMKERLKMGKEKEKGKEREIVLQSCPRSSIKTL